MLRVLCFTVVLVVPVTTWSQETPRGDAVIKEAAHLLETRLKKIDDPVQAAKVRNAIERLDALLSESGELVDFSDLNKNQNRYLGKTVTILGKVSMGSADGRTLQDMVGKPTTFLVYSQGTEASPEIELPKGLKVPDAKRGEFVFVTFRCTKGDWSDGNIATSIVRPQR